MKIKLDYREKELISLCKRNLEIVQNYKNIEIVVENLPLGDIILEENDVSLIIIERKTLADLGSSIKDGRYEEQSYRLGGLDHHNHNIIYLIEGDLNKYNVFRDRYDKTTIYSAMFSINYHKGFSLMRSMTIQETANIICNMAYKLNKADDNKKKGYYMSNIVVDIDKEKNTIEKTIENDNENENENEEDLNIQSKNTSYCNVIKKNKKDNITPDNIGEIMLCQIPSISSTTAKAILSSFSSIGELIKCVKEDNTCLNNITYNDSKGKPRKITKTSIANIIKYLAIS